MRKSSPLVSALFNATTQVVLGAVLLRPDREWYLSDLAGHLGVRPSTLQRVLARLVAGGILRTRKDGNRIYYRPDPDCPILGELAGILTKTSGIADPLRQALAPLAGIRVAFIHGSVARGRERSESDIDLIIVGDVRGPELALALRPVRDKLGREVNFTRYTASEFEGKLADGNHFLSSVMKTDRIFLIGDDHDLGEIAGGQPRGGRANEQGGARRTAGHGRRQSA